MRIHIPQPLKVNMSTALETILPPAELAAFTQELRHGLDKDFHLVQLFSESAGVVVVGVIAGGHSSWVMAPADSVEAAQAAGAVICNSLNGMVRSQAKQYVEAAEIAGGVIKKASEH